MAVREAPLVVLRLDGVALDALERSRPAMSISLSKWPMLPTMALFFMLAAASCAVRGVRGDARTAWSFAAIGVFLWGSAEIVFRLSVSDPDAWYPRSTQVLLFVAFAFAYVTLVLLARERVRRFDMVLALDGLLAGLAAAAVAAVALFPAHVERHVQGPAAPPQAFLLAALVGLIFVVAVLGMSGWQPGPSWALITAAIAVNVAGDAVLVHLADEGQFHRGSPADTLFVASALLLGLAALYPNYVATAPVGATRRLPGRC